MSTVTKAHSTPQSTGVILMTYGSATTSADVETFLRHVYPDPSAELITEFQRRFDVVGSSPLVEITIQQAKALDQALNQTHDTETYHVRAGMLHSHPFIAEAMTELKTAGVSRVLGILLSPQYSPFIMRGYDDALATAGAAAGFAPDHVLMTGSWGTEPKFVELLASRIRQLKTQLDQKYGQPTPVIFTTHSLPERVVQKDPSYLEQLAATTAAVVTKSGLTAGQWHTAYQSAGHTPEPWLKPDLTDVIADLKPQGAKAVLIVPIQFLADHLEILYDLDTAAAEQTEELGVHYHRLPVPGADPLFISALADIVMRNAPVEPTKPLKPATAIIGVVIGGGAIVALVFLGSRSSSLSSYLHLPTPKPPSAQALALKQAAAARKVQTCVASVKAQWSTAIQYAKDENLPTTTYQTAEQQAIAKCQSS